MIFGLCAAPICSANEKSTDKNKIQKVPEMAFLEFLAEMQEIDGKLLAPTDLLEIRPATKIGSSGVVDAESQTDILQLLNNEISAKQSPIIKQSPKNKDTKEEEKQ